MKNVDLTPYGLGKTNLIEIASGYFIHSEIVPFFKALAQEALDFGFEIRIESAYRSFDKQLSIWNRKAKGELPLLNAQGKSMEVPKDEEELMYAILTWSALPGTSRHHLGTDIDVVDGLKCPKGYEIQLTPEESLTLFSDFHHFLTERFERHAAFGFDRVYVPNRGKIKPELWHIAHLPTSRKCLEHFSLSTLEEIYKQTDIACKKAILANIKQLAEDYIYPYFI